MAVAWKAAGVENHEGAWEGIDFKEFQLIWAGRNQHVLHEKGMIGAGGDNADGNSVLLVPSRETVNDIDSFLCVEIVHGTLSINFE